ncbi:DUF397 domain-containing protein [Streptomyces sparsogenes]|uniref:DUF397 domain-containing protein n=1 Tax=Streptomyces sparsogenes TaxID=67365 RepID=UPI0009A07328
MVRLIWRKSSFSTGEAANCLELAADPTGTPRLRESDDPEVVITMPAATLRAFLRAAKAGEFDRMTQRPLTVTSCSRSSGPRPTACSSCPHE